MSKKYDIKMKRLMEIQKELQVLLTNLYYKSFVKLYLIGLWNGTIGIWQRLWHDNRLKVREKFLIKRWSVESRC